MCRRSVVGVQRALRARATALSLSGKSSLRNALAFELAGALNVLDNLWATCCLRAGRVKTTPPPTADAPAVRLDAGRRAKASVRGWPTAASLGLTPGGPARPPGREHLGRAEISVRQDIGHSVTFRVTLFRCGYVSSMGSALEIADSVRECAHPPMLVEATQAAERGDETCPVCGRCVTSDQKASLVLVDDGARNYVRLAHRTCRPSQIERIEPSGIAVMLADTFAFGWHTLLRKATPHAVLLWENKTNFDELTFDGLYEDWTGLEVEEWMGFKPATSGLDELAMPLIDLDPTWGYSTVAIHRKDCLEVIESGHQWHTLPGQPESWREQADRDGEILLLNGTVLRLDQYSADHVNERIAAGKVLAGVIPFAQDDGTAPLLPCQEPRELDGWIAKRRQG
jgi:hypothetical protein